MEFDQREELAYNRYLETLHVVQEPQEQQEDQQGQQDRMRQMAERPEEHFEHFHAEDFAPLNLQLDRGMPVFNDHWDNLTRQRNAADIQVVTRGQKKADRKRVAQVAQTAQAGAALLQKDADALRVTELTNRAVALKNDTSPDRHVDNIIAMSRIQSALQTNGSLPPREDVLGLTRRKNEQQYAKGSLLKFSVKKAAKKDVDNLVNNLRRDLCMEDPTYPEDVADIIDAYYLTRKFGEGIKADKQRALKQMKAAGQATPAEIAAASEQYKKLEQMTTFHSSICFNTSFQLAEMFNDIKARQLARQQILDEGTNEYNMQMVRILDREIAAAQEKYDAMLQQMRTANGSQNTPRGAAQLDSRAALAQITRQLKNPDITEEEKAQLEAHAQALFEGYDYAGPVQTGQIGADNV